MNYDFAVIGAGLTGSTISAVLAKNGFNVILLERGEGINYNLSETCLVRDIPLLEYLNITDKITASCLSEMICYYLDKNAYQKIRISHTFNERSIERGFLVRINRTIFDKTLLDCAIKNGVTFQPNCQVTQINLDSELPLVYYLSGYEEKIVTAKFIIDASGKSALIANKLNLKSSIKKLDNRIILFTHFENHGIRETLEDHAVYITEIENGHTFLCPLFGNRFSIGLVLIEAEYKKFINNEDAYKSCIKLIPWLSNIINASKQILPIIPAKNHSYLCENLLDNKYILVGEAAAFIDPFYCNGILTNLEMVDLAMATILDIKKINSDVSYLAKNYRKNVEGIIKNGKESLSKWINDNSLKLDFQGLLDPHIPYGILQFLLSTRINS